MPADRRRWLVSGKPCDVAAGTRRTRRSTTQAALERAAAVADAAHLDQAGDCVGRRATDQPPVMRRNEDADRRRPARAKQSARPRMLDQRQRQRVLPEPGRSADQHAAIADARPPWRGCSIWRMAAPARRPAASRRSARRLISPGLVAEDVLGRQRAAMRLDDLPADRQAEAGILAERLAGRPVGVEALEDAVDVVGADARAIVVDGQTMNLPAARDSDTVMRPPSSGTKERAFSIRLVMTWPMRRSWPTTMKPLTPCGSLADLEFDLDRLLAAPGLAATRRRGRRRISSGRPCRRRRAPVRHRAARRRKYR